MEIGIIGLPKSGKTTLFYALTQGRAEAPAHGGKGPNVGVVRVPDPRLDTLTTVFKPHRTVQADVTYVDIAVPPQGFSRGDSSGRQSLTQVAKADALIHVARAFTDPRVPHPEGSVNPERDLATMNLELAFTDAEFLERRLQRLGESLKAAKSHERETGQREQAFLGEIKTRLEAEVPIHAQPLSQEQRHAIENYPLLTTKPLLLLLNIGEEQLPQADQMVEEFRQKYAGPQTQVVALCAQLEVELSQMGSQEAQEFRQALGATQTSLDQVIQRSFELLGLITFFTHASNEVKAWTIRRGLTAPQAAGNVHTDMERGFIRAEVVAYEDLARLGSLVEARRHGLLRAEGRHYVVQDGDIITFLFNV